MEEDKGNTYRLKSTPARGGISDQRQKSYRDFKEIGRGVLMLAFATA